MINNPKNTPIMNSLDSANDFISISPEEETPQSLIRKETKTSPSPSTSASMMGHEDRTTPRARESPGEEIVIRIRYTF